MRGKTKEFWSLRKRQKRAKALKMLGGLITSPFASSRTGHVAMFHIGRSGSTVLCDLLGQHPSMFWDGEGVSRYIIRTRKKGLDLAERELPGEAMDFLRARKRWAGHKTYGFEAKFYQLKMVKADLAYFIEQLRTMGYTHFIVLKRKNYLRKVISSLRARQDKRWHQRDDETPEFQALKMDVNDVQIDGDARPLLAYFQEWDQKFATLDELLSGNELLHLSYEDDVEKDPSVGYRRVCEFLGLPAHDVEVRYGKTTPYPMEKIVSNIDDVASALTGTSYEWMLDG